MVNGSKVLKSFPSYKRPSLFTPARKLSLKLNHYFKPGKRNNDEPIYNYNNLDPVVATPPSIQEYGHSHVHKVPNRQLCAPGIALQNEDIEEDVVVITTLDTVPFCCHEDLLSMARKQLIGVALILNTKLPAILHIDVDPARPDTYIRNSIEFLVGIRTEPPPAPKAEKRRRPDIDTSNSILGTLLFNLSPPASPSPKSRRTRPSDMYMSLTPQLERLNEEDEDDDILERPMKRRKVSGRLEGLALGKDTAPPGPTARPSTPRPLRSRSCRVTVAPNGSPIPRAVRSVSDRVPSKLREVHTEELDTSFVTTARPQYQLRGNIGLDSVRTSTPKDNPAKTSSSLPSLKDLDSPPVLLVAAISKRSRLGTEKDSESDDTCYGMKHVSMKAEGSDMVICT